MPADERPVLGVDTEVLLDGELLGKPADATEAEAMLEALAGRTHEVVSGLCLRTPAWEELHERDDARHVPRADAARPRALRRERSSGRDARVRTRSRVSARVSSTRIEGDFLNVVGLPAALLVQLLATRFAGVYGFG